METIYVFWENLDQDLILGIQKAAGSPKEFKIKGLSPQIQLPNLSNLTCSYTLI